MVKRGRLSKEEKQYITEHAEEGSKTISKHLDRSVASIEKILEGQEESDTATKSKSGDLMARNEKYGAVIMTESASMAADESKKPSSKKEESEEEPSIPSRYRYSLHRIKKD